MSIEIAYTPSVEPGTHEAVVTNVETRVSQKNGNQYRWWEFTTEDGRTVSAISSMMVGPKSKAGQWIAALIGRQPVIGESVEVVGLPCLISVSTDEDGFAQIDTVVGRPKKAATRTSVAETIAKGAASPTVAPTLTYDPGAIPAGVTDDLPF